MNVLTLFLWTTSKFALIVFTVLEFKTALYMQSASVLAKYCWLKIAFEERMIYNVFSFYLNFSFLTWREGKDCNFNYTDFDLISEMEMKWEWEATFTVNYYIYKVSDIRCLLSCQLSQYTIKCCYRTWW